MESLFLFDLVCPKKTAVVLVWLIGLTSCQPPSVLEYDREYSGYGEEPKEVESQPQQIRRRAPGYHAEEPGQQGFSPTEYDTDLDDRQSNLISLANSLINMVMGFVRPLFSNLGIGTSNAILATMLRRRLALIPEARKTIASINMRPKLASPTRAS